MKANPKAMSPVKLTELINNLDMAPILDNQVRQVRWLYHNSNKCTRVYDEKLVRIMIHRLTTALRNQPLNESGKEVELGTSEKYFKKAFEDALFVGESGEVKADKRTERIWTIVVPLTYGKLIQGDPPTTKYPAE